MKIISLRIHGVLDWLTVGMLAAYPKLLAISGLPAQVLYGLAGVALVVAVTSKTPAGLIKVLPMRVHAAIELALSPVLPALPWLLGFEDQLVARYLFIALGAALFLVWLLTDYEQDSIPAVQPA